jgi:L-ascorbate metabolism protein UlaG (beta-lactamase superfamily)
MDIRWFGQSAFLLTAEQSVFIDPFGMTADAMKAHGLEFNYPRIEGVSADLLLITHEHGDHNAAEEIGGDPVIIRSTAGRIDSPVGEVLAVASEHDAAAGTQRGPNTIFAFTLGNLRVCHFGDFGQAALRPEQLEALERVDVLMLPVGGGLTIGGEAAAAIARALKPLVVIPMHYRTERINFLEPPDAFLSAYGADVIHVSSSEPIDDLVGTSEEPRVAVMAAP